MIQDWEVMAKAHRLLSLLMVCSLAQVAVPPVIRADMTGSGHSATAVTAKDHEPSPVASSIPPGAAPKAACAAPSWDFGTEANTNRVEHAFELTNEGSAPLQIQRVFAGCGCAAVRTGADNVEPGGKTQVTVTFNLAGRTGEQRKSVYVHTNDPEKPILHLEVKGQAIGSLGTNGVSDLVNVGVWNGKARVMPERVDLGRVRADAVSEGEILLRGNSSNDVVAVEGVKTGLSNLTARVEESNGTSRVVLRLLSSSELGPGSATVSIRTSHPVLKTVIVPVKWKAEGDIYATPEDITVTAGYMMTNTAVRHVAIRSRKGTPFRLDAVSSDQAGVLIHPTPLPGGKGFLLQINGLLPDTNAAVREITVRGGDGFRLSIPIRTVVFKEKI